MIKTVHTLLDRWRGLSFARQLGAAVALGLAFRLVWAFVVPVEPVSDSGIYWLTSQNIAEHGVYGITPEQPFSYWPVGAAGVYAAAYKLFGVNFISVQIINLIAGAGVIATTGLLARRWFGETAGVAATAVIAFWPSLIMFTTVLASEIFFMLFTNIALLAQRSDGKRWIVYAVIAGVAIVSAAYARPIALLFPVVFLAVDVIARKAVSLRPFLFAGVSLAVAGLLLAPWVMRNYELHGEVVLVSTNGAPNLWMGNNPDSTGGYMPLPEYTNAMSEIERADALGEIAVAYMLENPLRTAFMFVKRLIDTHKRETIAVAWNEQALTDLFGEGVLLPAKLVASGYWMTILLAGLAGAGLIAGRALQQEKPFDMLAVLAHPAVVLWAYYIAVHSVIVSGDRYHFPSIPLAAIMAGFAFVAFRARFARPLQPQE